MDRITKVWFKNLRTLADVELDVDGLTVLVGDNGSGKSTLLEGLQLLARCARPDFLRELARVHGGTKHIARAGAMEVVLGCRLNYEFEPRKHVEYEICIDCFDSIDYLSIRREEIRYFPDESVALVTMHREAQVLRVATVSFSDSAENPHRAAEVPYGETALNSVGLFADPSTHAVRAALMSIVVHAGFRLAPRWVSLSEGLQPPIRTGGVLLRSERLELGASNLASVYHFLKNEQGPRHWADTLDLIRLGLGDHIEELGVSIDADDARATVAIKYPQHDAMIPAGALSDGTLAWLAFVALYRTTKPGELVAFDEPELHLHPKLLFRVVGLFESMARRGPVVLATHSDRLLDFLQEPSRSVVVCELDEQRHTRLRRPDAEALASWMGSYSGYGSIRTAGHEESILREPEP